MPMIYMLIGPNNKNYIGKTKYDFKYRWKLHCRDYKKYVKCLKLDLPYKGCSALYAAFSKYSIENFKYCILHNGDFNPDELRSLEFIEIEDNKTYSPHGYNLTTGGEGGHTSIETRTKMSISQQARAQSHSIEHRKHKLELDGLPMYVIYYKKGNIQGYRISKHPKCKNKRFVSKTKKLEDLKQEVLIFLDKLNTVYIPTYIEKQIDLPSGISFNNHGTPGYVMSFTIKSIKYYKKFNQKSDECNREDAITFMEKFRTHLKTDHECSSETKCQSIICKEIRVSKRLT